jgi:hypothetical protein
MNRLVTVVIVAHNRLGADGKETAWTAAPRAIRDQFPLSGCEDKYELLQYRYNVITQAPSKGPNPCPIKTNKPDVWITKDR